MLFLGRFVLAPPNHPTTEVCETNLENGAEILPSKPPQPHLAPFMSFLLPVTHHFTLKIIIVIIIKTIEKSLRDHSTATAAHDPAERCKCLSSILHSHTKAPTAFICQVFRLLLLSVIKCHTCT